MRWGEKVCPISFYSYESICPRWRIWWTRGRFTIQGRVCFCSTCHPRGVRVCEKRSSPLLNNKLRRLRAGPMVGQRLRRWPTIDPALRRRLVLPLGSAPHRFTPAPPPPEVACIYSRLAWSSVTSSLLLVCVRLFLFFFCHPKKTQ